LLVFFYVDDVLVASKDVELAQETLEVMEKHVDLCMMGEATRFLGREIKRDGSQKSLNVTQTKFTEELLAGFGMDDAIANLRATPMDANLRLQQAAKGELLGP
jgi:hypothetical protein